MEAGLIADFRFQIDDWRLKSAMAAGVFILQSKIAQSEIAPVPSVFPPLCSSMPAVVKS